MILVAGGSGTLGTRLVPLLTRRGQRVRVLTRERARATHIGGEGVEVVAGDVREAGSLLRAKRYNSRYAYRDYLGLLHSMDRSTEAWDAFNLLARQIDAPELWETALVGHQRAGATEVEIGAWAAQDWVRKAGKFGYAAMYLLRASVTDRMPSKDLSRLVAEVDRPVWKGLEGSVVRPALDNPMDQQLLGPKSGSESNVVIASPDALRGQRVKSDLVTFAEAYRAIRVGDFRAAHAEMLRASLLLDMTQPALSYLLPYYAYAAAKAGHLSMIVALLEGMPADRRRAREPYHSRHTCAEWDHRQAGR